MTVAYKRDSYTMKVLAKVYEKAIETIIYLYTRMRAEKGSKGVDFMLLTPNYPENPLHPNPPPPPISKSLEITDTTRVSRLNDPRGQCLLH